MGESPPSRLHRWLLLLYPPAFRRQEGAQILAFWTTQRHESRYSLPLVGAIRYWIDVVGDALGNGLRLRRGPTQVDPLNLDRHGALPASGKPGEPDGPGFLPELALSRRSIY